MHNVQDEKKHSSKLFGKNNQQSLWEFNIILLILLYWGQPDYYLEQHAYNLLIKVLLVPDKQVKYIYWKYFSKLFLCLNITKKILAYANPYMTLRMSLLNYILEQIA